MAAGDGPTWQGTGWSGWLGHPGEASGYVLSGGITLRLGVGSGRGSHEVAPGDGFFVPAGEKYQTQNGPRPGLPTCWELHRPAQENDVRVRCFDGLSIAVSHAVLPCYLARAWKSPDFAAASLHDLLRMEYHVYPTRGQSAIEARACGQAEARHLGLRRGEPALVFAQTGHDQLDRAFELARVI